jgi:endonuclease-3
MKSLDRAANKAKAAVVKRRPPKAKAPARNAKRRTRLSKPAIAEMFRRFRAADPDPKSELEYVNPFTLLVAVVLSAQATDAGVNKATRALFKIADTPEKMVRLGEEGIRNFVKTIGLYRNKARNVLELSRQLVANHGGEVPRDRDALEALPGVGRKTANVVLNVAFGEPTMAVDTHVFRVANRTGLSSGRTPVEVEEDLLRVTPDEFAMHAHHWLILHGRYVCKARRPECPRCLIRDLCLFEAKTP